MRRTAFGPWVTTAALAALPFAAFYALPLDRSWLIAALVGPVVVAALLPVAIRRSRRILNSTRPLVDTARTLILLLTMIVLAFASTYDACSETHSPGEVRGLETKTDAVYFTVTILSTVGFGDIYPAGQTARAVATLHMVSNLVLVAVSVRLVTWAARRRADGTRLLSEAPTPPRLGGQRLSPSGPSGRGKTSLAAASPAAWTDGTRDDACCGRWSHASVG